MSPNNQNTLRNSTICYR